MSKAAASACAAARVAQARPPRRSPAAVERIRTPRSLGSKSMRARSPSSDPPDRRELGSTASIATEQSRSRQLCSSAESNVDLPAPGGPVTPITCAGASPPSAAGDTSPRRAAACSRSLGAVLSSRLRAAGAAVRSRARRRAPIAAPTPPAEPGDTPCGRIPEPPNGASLTRRRWRRRRLWRAATPRRRLPPAPRCRA